LLLPKKGGPSEKESPFAFTASAARRQGDRMLATRPAICSLALLGYLQDLEPIGGQVILDDLPHHPSQIVRFDGVELDGVGMRSGFVGR